ncbi:hypothetical protein BC940DRAFT_300943 [Gongronella butleri]|nr:hypothetical protein BC940DRAFT_300943 [Gongronella butleri]
MGHLFRNLFKKKKAKDVETRVEKASVVDAPVLTTQMPDAFAFTHGSLLDDVLHGLDAGLSTPKFTPDLPPPSPVPISAAAALVSPSKNEKALAMLPTPESVPEKAFSCAPGSTPPLSANNQAPPAKQRSASSIISSKKDGASVSSSSASISIASSLRKPSSSSAGSVAIEPCSSSSSQQQQQQQPLAPPMSSYHHPSSFMARMKERHRQEVRRSMTPPCNLPPTSMPSSMSIVSSASSITSSSPIPLQQVSSTRPSSRAAAQVVANSLPGASIAEMHHPLAFSMPQQAMQSMQSMQPMQPMQQPQQQAMVAPYAPLDASPPTHLQSFSQMSPLAPLPRRPSSFALAGYHSDIVLPSYASNQGLNGNGHLTPSPLGNAISPTMPPAPPLQLRASSSLYHLPKAQPMPRSMSVYGQDTLFLQQQPWPNQQIQQNPQNQPSRPMSLLVQHQHAPLARRSMALLHDPAPGPQLPPTRRTSSPATPLTAPKVADDAPIRPPDHVSSSARRQSSPLPTMEKKKRVDDAPFVQIAPIAPPMTPETRNSSPIPLPDAFLPSTHSPTMDSPVHSVDQDATQDQDASDRTAHADDRQSETSSAPSTIDNNQMSLPSQKKKKKKRMVQPLSPPSPLSPSPQAMKALEHEQQQQQQQQQHRRRVRRLSLPTRFASTTPVSMSSDESVSSSNSSISTGSHHHHQHHHPSPASHHPHHHHSHHRHTMYFKNDAAPPACHDWSCTQCPPLPPSPMHDACCSTSSSNASFYHHQPMYAPPSSCCAPLPAAAPSSCGYHASPSPHHHHHHHHDQHNHHHTRHHRHQHHHSAMPVHSHSHCVPPSSTSSSRSRHSHHHHHYRHHHRQKDHRHHHQRTPSPQPSNSLKKSISMMPVPSSPREKLSKSTTSTTLAKKGYSNFEQHQRDGARRAQKPSGRIVTSQSMMTTVMHEEDANDAASVAPTIANSIYRGQHHDATPAPAAPAKKIAPAPAVVTSSRSIARFRNILPRPALFSRKQMNPSKSIHTMATSTA